MVALYWETNMRGLLLVALLGCMAGCNQPTAATGPATVAAAPVPPTPPSVPQYHRTAEQEGRWQQYLVAKQAYEDELAHARDQGRQQQAAADAGRQANAFDAGRLDQGRIDQARRDLAQAYQQAKLEPDPRRREQMINQAKANLAAATQGQ